MEKFPETSIEEIEEQAEEVGKLTPIDFAKLIGKAPQLVYYYIRTGVIKDERCACGRKVVDVHSAREALETKESKRRGVDRRSDEVQSRQND